MKLSWKSGKLLQLKFKYTWVHVQVHQSALARRGVPKHEIGCTWVETAGGALCRQVLQCRADEAEKNLSAKCSKCSFNLNVNKEVAKNPNAEVARQEVLGTSLVNQLIMLWLYSPDLYKLVSETQASKAFLLNVINMNSSIQQTNKK